MMRAALVALSCALGAEAARRETPVEKVITMLTELQDKVHEEGSAEAATYDKFACFCKSTTDKKSTAITDGETAVEAANAKIDSVSAARATLNAEITQLNDDVKTFDSELKDQHELRLEAKHTFEESYKDMQKAVSALERAVVELKAGKTVDLAQIKTLVQKSIIVADALGLGQTALLEEVPTSDYDFHSNDIVDTMEGLLAKFRTKVTSLGEDDANAESDYKLARQAKEEQRRIAVESLQEKQVGVADASTKLATTQADLTESNAVLNDDRVFLQELTAKCSDKAKMWDQRSTMRADELAALQSALEVLQTTASEMAEATGAGGRALVQAPSFIQTAQAPRKIALLKAEVVLNTPRSHKRAALVAMLSKAGLKLNSAAISSLAVSATEDPFVKIKGIIQSLIERLIQEEADEASHKGWCDGEIAKTTKARDYRLRDVTALQTSVAQHEARHGKLTEDTTENDKAIKELDEILTNSTTTRDEESAENEQVVKDGKAGVDAMKKAIDVLTQFYGAAAKAELLQRQDPAAGEPDAGFDGAYQGSQAASGGILGMMEVIKSDFERTISETESNEAQSKRDFTEFDRASRASLAAKNNAKEALATELTEVESGISSERTDLRSKQKMLDTAVETWEALLPDCVVNPGMDAEERAAKRDAEVGALKDAYCILSDEDAGCSGVFLQKRLY